MSPSHRSLSLLALLVFTAALPQLGCKDKKVEDETSEKEEKSEKKKKKSADDEESTEEESKSKKKKKAADDEEESGLDKLSKLGIKSCDKYLAKMQECADKAAKPARSGILDAAKSTHKAWKDSAESSPAAKMGLEIGCKSALKSAGTAYKSVCKGVFDEEEEE